MGEESTSSKYSAKDAVWVAWSLMEGFRKGFLLAILAMLCGTGMRYLVPLVASGTIDYALGETDNPSWIVGVFQGLVEKTWLADNLWLIGYVGWRLFVDAGSRTAWKAAAR